MHRIAPLLLLLLVPAAFAQGRLNAPNYFLSQLQELQPGDVLEGELSTSDGQNFKDGSYLDLFLVYGEEGEYVELLASSHEIDTYLALFGPDGSLVASNDDGPSYLDAQIGVSLPEAGRYLLVVTGYSQLDLGPYTVSRGAPASATPVDAVALEVPGVVTGAFDVDRSVVVPYLETPGLPYSFELDAPAAVAVYLSSPDFDTYLVITDADGYVLSENDDANYSETTDYSTDSLAFLELEAGTYHVYVSTWYYGLDSEGSLGEFTLELKRFVAAD